MKKYINLIHSKNGYQVLLLVEFFVYTIILISRIRWVFHLKSIPDGLFELISLFDLENGWGILCISGLLIGVLITIIHKKWGWGIRQTFALSYISHRMFMSAWGLNVVFICILYFINTPMIVQNIGINKNERIWITLISVLMAIGIMFASEFLPFITYGI